MDVLTRVLDFFRRHFLSSSQVLASVLTYVLCDKKNRLAETVLLSTHNICFGWEIRKLFFVTQS